MSFDMPPDEPGYPCECGGSIEPMGEWHIVLGYCGNPPEQCCQRWRCDKCLKGFNACGAKE